MSNSSEKYVQDHWQVDLKLSGDKAEIESVTMSTASITYKGKSCSSETQLSISIGHKKISPMSFQKRTMLVFKLDYAYY